MVALEQFHVTVAAEPQVRTGPHVAVQLGRGASMHETVAVAVAVAPPAPTALMVQRSPTEPTVYGLDPEQGTEPLDGEVPVHS